MNNKGLIILILAVGLLAFTKKKKRYKIIVPPPDKITEDEFFK
jgi:hypothetical protein